MFHTHPYKQVEFENDDGELIYDSFSINIIKPFFVVEAKENKHPHKKSITFLYLNEQLKTFAFDEHVTILNASLVMPGYMTGFAGFTMAHLAKVVEMKPKVSILEPGLPVTLYYLKDGREFSLYKESDYKESDMTPEVIFDYLLDADVGMIGKGEFIL